VTGAESLARALGRLTAPLGYVAAGRLGFFCAIPLLLDAPGAGRAMTLFSLTAVLGSAPAVAALVALRRAAAPPPIGPLARRAGGLGVSGGLITVGTRGNVILLAHVEGLRAAAAFEAAWRGFQLAVYAVGAIGTATTPFAARALAAGGSRHLLRTTLPAFVITLAAGVLGAAVIELGSEPLATALIGGHDTAAIDALRALGIALPFTYVAYFLQTAIVLPLRALRTLIVASAALCAVTLAFTAGLAHDHGAAGAAVGVLAGQIAFLALLAVGARRELRAGA
jgi:O-antigen/teichoic acid export membrane protein